MKNFSEKNKKIRYLAYILTVIIIVVSSIQVLSFTPAGLNFNLGEYIIVNFADSYTSYYSFPFLFGLYLILNNIEEPNFIHYINRYSKRSNFIRDKLYANMVELIKYISLITVFSMFYSIFNLGFSLKPSKALEDYFSRFDKSIFFDNNLIYIFSSIVFYVLIFTIFINLILLLSQTRMNIGLQIGVYTFFIILLSIMSLGAFGEVIRKYSIFYILSPMRDSGLEYVFSILYGLVLNLLLYKFNIFIFNRRELVMPKGNKIYQNE